MPVGGTTGQILVKLSDNNFDTDWVEAPDGTDAVVFGGTAPVNNELVIFNGTTGKLIKRSSIPASSLAFAADLANKVDVIIGKGLSANDLTNALKSKLDNLPAAGFFRGNFANIAAVNAFSFNPVPAVGDYVTVVGPTFARYWWSPASVWVIESEESLLNAADIADILFDDGETWTLGGNILFTPTYLALLNEHQTIIENVGLGTASTTPKGFASYFSIAGQTIVITTISDGTNNYVLVNPATAVSGDSNQFTGGTGSLGRLQYTGTVTPRVFSIHATVSHSGGAGDLALFAIAKNGAAISESRTLNEIKTAAEVHQVSVTALVSLATNDYVEVFVANTSSTGDVKVHALSISASLG